MSLLISLLCCLLFDPTWLHEAIKPSAMPHLDFLIHKLSSSVAQYSAAHSTLQILRGFSSKVSSKHNMGCFYFKR